MYVRIGGGFIVSTLNLVFVEPGDLPEPRLDMAACPHNANAPNAISSIPTRSFAVPRATATLEGKKCPRIIPSVLALWTGMTELATGLDDNDISAFLLFQPGIMWLLLLLPASLGTLLRAFR